MVYLVSFYSISYTIANMSSANGIIKFLLISGDTVLKPRNMNKRINDALSLRFFFIQMKTRSQFNFSSANSNSSTKLSLEPSTN